MIEEVLPDFEALAQRAAEVLAEQAWAAVRARGRFLLALSGGSTPRRMLEHLAERKLPWSQVELFQVDERIVPAEDDARNLKMIRAGLGACFDEIHVHAMPVEDPDLAAAAARYGATLRSVASMPATLDVVHLGIGADGHTASLVPGDPVLEVSNVEVALTGVYQGHRRMTLTYPVLDQARVLLWMVTGAEKASALERLRAGDRSIPAGRVDQSRALLLADRTAAR